MGEIKVFTCIVGCILADTWLTRNGYDSTYHYIEGCGNIAQRSKSGSVGQLPKGLACVYVYGDCFVVPEEVAEMERSLRKLYEEEKTNTIGRRLGDLWGGIRWSASAEERVRE
jgi:hypothetical protein